MQNQQQPFMQNQQRPFIQPQVPPFMQPQIPPQVQPQVQPQVMPQQPPMVPQIPNQSQLSPYQTRFTANDLPIPGRCGTQANDRIVGGEETSLMDYPWYVIWLHDRQTLFILIVLFSIELQDGSFALRKT